MLFLGGRSIYGFDVYEEQKEVFIKNVTKSFVQLKH